MVSMMNEIHLDTKKENRMKVQVIKMEQRFLRQKKMTEAEKVKDIRHMIERESFANY